MKTRLFLFAAICIALPVIPASADDAGVTGQQLLGDWTELVLSWSRLLAFITSAAGVVLAAVSIKRAHDANDDNGRAKHLGAALFAGVFSITFVIIGWVSNILIPA